MQLRQHSITLELIPVRAHNQAAAFPGERRMTRPYFDCSLVWVPLILPGSRDRRDEKGGQFYSRPFAWPKNMNLVISCIIQSSKSRLRTTGSGTSASQIEIEFITHLIWKSSIISQWSISSRTNSSGNRLILLVSRLYISSSYLKIYPSDFRDYKCNTLFCLCVFQRFYYGYSHLPSSGGSPISSPWERYSHPYAVQLALDITPIELKACFLSLPTAVCNCTQLELAHIYWTILVIHGKSGNGFLGTIDSYRNRKSL